MTIGESMSHYEMHLEKAWEFYNEGNYEAVRAALVRALESPVPDGDCRAKALLAQTCRHLEYDDEARRLYEECVRVQPTPACCAELALMMAEKGECTSACRELAEGAIEEDPDIGSAYMALFYVHAHGEDYEAALRALKRGLRRGVEFQEAKVFESLREWCQRRCDSESVYEALSLSAEVVDFFGSFDFCVLHARLAELAGEHRVAVQYYKRTLGFLRPGALRTDVLEAIARVAI